MGEIADHDSMVEPDDEQLLAECLAENERLHKLVEAYKQMVPEGTLPPAGFETFLRAAVSDIVERLRGV
jgi:hypothetical protein